MITSPARDKSTDRIRDNESGALSVSVVISSPAKDREEIQVELETLAQLETVKGRQLQLER